MGLHLILSAMTFICLLVLAYTLKTMLAFQKDLTQQLLAQQKDLVEKLMARDLQDYATSVMQRMPAPVAYPDYNSLERDFRQVVDDGVGGMTE